MAIPKRKNDIKVYQGNELMGRRQELLDKIIELHFDNYKFTQKGSLEWCPIIGKIQSKNRVIYKNINP